MNWLRTLFAAIGAVVLFGAALYAVAVAAYCVERRFK